MRDLIVETVQELTNDRLHDRFFVVFSREHFDRVDRVPNGGDDEPAQCVEGLGQVLVKPAKAVGGITHEVTTQYVLRFTPDIEDTKTKVFRKVTVEIPTLPNVKISARKGYYPHDVPVTPGAVPPADKQTPKETAKLPAKQ